MYTDLPNWGNDTNYIVMVSTNLEIRVAIGEVLDSVLKTLYFLETKKNISQEIFEINESKNIKEVVIALGNKKIKVVKVNGLKNLEQILVKKRI